jgi:two-component system, LytTR family, response regulator
MNMDNALIPLTALIVDDERLARRELRRLLEEEFSDKIRVVGEAASKREAVELLNHPPDGIRPDVVFLDINMPQGSGFDVLEEVDYNYDGTQAAMQQTLSIVFVTAYDHYALRAFEVNALDYVLKPLDPDRLERTIGRLWGVHRKSLLPDTAATTTPASPEPAPKLSAEDYVFVTIGKQRRFVPVLEIMCITANDNYTELWLPDGANAPKCAMMLRAMNEWEMALPETVFFRIHRSTIINTNYLDATRAIEPIAGGGALVFMQNMDKPFAMSRRTFTKWKEQR